MSQGFRAAGSVFICAGTANSSPCFTSITDVAEQKPQKFICKYGKWPPATSIECQHKKGWVMEVSNLLRQKLMVNARSMIDKLSKFRIAFTLSSSGYCAIHWLVSHNFSVFVFSRALFFGAIAAMAVVWLSHFAQKHRKRSFAGEHGVND
jgi:hypothetical protein